MEVLPDVLAFLPRYARGLGVQPTARHKGVVDHREGVAFSPFDNKYSEMRRRMRVHLERGKVGSCRLLLRGRLQRLFQFLFLQLLSNLRSEDFKQVVVVLILFTCALS